MPQQGDRAAATHAAAASPGSTEEGWASASGEGGFRDSSVRSSEARTSSSSTADDGVSLSGGRPGRPVGVAAAAAATAVGAGASRGQAARDSSAAQSNKAHFRLRSRRRRLLQQVVGEVVECGGDVG